ncbi:unnamed protein product [Choristocarpus tenellus]
MSWLFGTSGKRQPQGQSDVRAARERQVHNLKEKVQGLQEKSTDTSLFEVQISAPPDGRPVMLRVFLPTKFPSERPAVLQLLSKVSHRWVNQYMQVVGHPDLNGWDGTSPQMIGDIVAGVIEEFRRDCNIGSSTSPPVVDPASQWSGYGSQPVQPFPGQGVRSDTVGNLDTSRRRSGEKTLPSAGGHSPPRVTPGGAAEAGEQTRGTRIPAIPSQFEELQNLTTAQLTRLLEDDVARQTMIQAMQSVVGMKEVRTEMRKSNFKVAQSTMGKQEAIDLLRTESENMKLTLKDIKEAYDGEAQAHGNTTGGTPDQVILKQVKRASQEADNISEKIANSFLERQLSLSDFLNDFIRERQRYHVLAAKIECMKRDIHF